MIPSQDINLLQKVAAYIERTQPLLDRQAETLTKQAEDKSAFIKRATQAAGVLAHRGVIDPRRVSEFVDKVAADPTSVWAFIEKLAGSITPDALGDAVRTKIASGGTVDPWERVFFGVGAENTGMVQ